MIDNHALPCSKQPLKAGMCTHLEVCARTYGPLEAARTNECTSQKTEYVHVTLTLNQRPHIACQNPNPNQSLYVDRSSF